ncbi:hypothetical protein ACFQLX_23930 [Streptomyces polyrhachis]|uniref:Transposase n=1 Tax=Streptomyces polyrhachis TaxID=1282885 RepID=A0ABW2GMI1_9ACTN
MSDEAVYTWIYALPKGELAKSGVILPCGRTRRGPKQKPASGNGARIVGMRSIHDRPAEALVHDTWITSNVVRRQFTAFDQERGIAISSWRKRPTPLKLR